MDYQVPSEKLKSSQIFRNSPIMLEVENALSHASPYSFYNCQLQFSVFSMFSRSGQLKEYFINLEKHNLLYYEKTKLVSEDSISNLKPIN